MKKIKTGSNNFVETLDSTLMELRDKSFLKKCIKIFCNSSLRSSFKWSPSLNYSSSCFEDGCVPCLKCIK